MCTAIASVSLAIKAMWSDLYRDEECPTAPLTTCGERMVMIVDHALNELFVFGFFHVDVGRCKVAVRGQPGEARQLICMISVAVE